MGGGWSSFLAQTFQRNKLHEKRPKNADTMERSQMIQDFDTSLKNGTLFEAREGKSCVLIGESGGGLRKSIHDGTNG